MVAAKAAGASAKLVLVETRSGRANGSGACQANEMVLEQDS